jgi:hypothetical protein
MTDLQKTIKMLDGGKALIEQAKSEEGLWIMGHQDLTNLTKKSERRLNLEIERHPWKFKDHLHGIRIERDGVKLIRFMEWEDHGKRRLDFDCEWWPIADVVINADEKNISVHKVSAARMFHTKSDLHFVENDEWDGEEEKRRYIEAGWCETEDEFWAEVLPKLTGIQINKTATLTVSGDGYI